MHVRVRHGVPPFQLDYAIFFLKKWANKYALKWLASIWWEGIGGKRHRDLEHQSDKRGNYILLLHRESHTQLVGRLHTNIERERKKGGRDKATLDKVDLGEKVVENF